MKNFLKYLWADESRLNKFLAMISLGGMFMTFGNDLLFTVWSGILVFTLYRAYYV